MAPDAAAPIAVGLPMAAGLGLMYGMGPCLVSCLPFLAPVFMSAENGFAPAMRVMATHSSGRLVGYGLTTGMAGFLGGYSANMLGPAIVNMALGAATLLTGLAILLAWRLRIRGCGGGCSGHDGWEQNAIRQFMPSGVFLMGLGMAFTPCAPMTVVLFSAATAASWSVGLGLGLAFGLGAITIPSLAYGFGFSWFARELRVRLGPWAARLELLSGALLLGLGLLTLFR